MISALGPMLPQFPDLAACLTASAERPAGALMFAPCRAGGTYFLALGDHT